ncbi:MAG: DUF434 domain-containing protein [Clostridia bacterium]|nr:DUF434 domain-containing protein [Clostridia bacterium]
MNAKRGYVPEDGRNFSPEGLKAMRTASRHVRYLINEGYGLKQAVTFVGNHFLLSERQRLAVMRSLATEEELSIRRAKEVSAAALSGGEANVDGFNAIITLEVLASDSILLSCMDGTVRDLAALRGTYKIIPETQTAVRMLFGALSNLRVRAANVFLDEPVSNSGRLKALLAEIGEEYPFRLNVQILRDVDRTLYDRENVITTDCVILDRCASWFNLTAMCMKPLGRQGLCVWERTRPYMEA